MMSLFVKRFHCLQRKLSPSPVLTLFILRPFCYQTRHDNFPSTLSPSSSSMGPALPQSFVKTICSMVLESYYKQTHFLSSPPKLNLYIDTDSLTHEQAITVVASLANEAGSMVALSFFHWAIGFAKFRHFMRLYIVCATTLIDNGNFERAHEVMQCMVRSFAEIGRLKEAFSMVIEVSNHGLPLVTGTFNFVMGIACEMGLVEFAEKVFEEMDGNVSMAVKLFHRMGEHGCVRDSFTYGALISGLCKESKLAEACELYETMIDKGISPCEVTRVTLAYEYCKKDDSAMAMVVLENLDKKLWIRTVNTLVRKLCSESKVGIAAFFFHKLLDKDHNVDRVTLAAFMTACYENSKYALVSEFSERISKRIVDLFIISSYECCCHLGVQLMVLVGTFLDLLRHKSGPRDYLLGQAALHLPMPAVHVIWFGGVGGNG
ncbi:hypothetical protein Pint_14062 [Pistacia integerrima]|uniref:Uncharacterized protein n=1 Tax=Pistacia integerrima TaxID=434235 RepID=A0ACC0Y671_9ROSI|nr:hypothetical protein Pint_14062 [Pistacia integerrima]